LTSGFDFCREGIGGGGDVQVVVLATVAVIGDGDDVAVVGVVGNFGVLSHDEARGTRIGSSDKPDLSIELDLLCRANFSIFWRLSCYMYIPVESLSKQAPL